MIVTLAIAGILLATLPALMFLANLPLFVLADTGTREEDSDPRRISVLIPARDEQGGIERCIRSALASQGVEIEVVVLDDHSTDRTAEIVQSLASRDPRVRYLKGQTLPPDWNGKQFACFQLASAASGEWFVFLDADVRLHPCGIRRLADYQRMSEVDLLSAFPHQETGTFLEKCLVPMMHVILLGYLPLRRMRASSEAAYAAGCGQLFMTSRPAYQAAGTHEVIRQSRHDGLKLPRAYRLAGLKTDVVDGTELASCRMYHSAGEVVRGLLKNAHEGIANARLILPFTVLLVGSGVLPLAVLVASVVEENLFGGLLALIGVGLGHLPRAVGAVKFRQSYLGVLFHGFAIAIFVTLQWVALLMHAAGRSVAWRGRGG